MSGASSCTFHASTTCAPMGGGSRGSSTTPRRNNKEIVNLTPQNTFSKSVDQRSCISSGDHGSQYDGAPISGSIDVTHHRFVGGRVCIAPLCQYIAGLPPSLGLRGHGGDCVEITVRYPKIRKPQTLFRFETVLDNCCARQNFTRLANLLNNYIS